MLKEKGGVLSSIILVIQIQKDLVTLGARQILVLSTIGVSTGVMNGPFANTCKDFLLSAGLIVKLGEVRADLYNIQMLLE